MTTNATINKASFPIVFTASCSGRYTTVDVIYRTISGITSAATAANNAKNISVKNTPRYGL